MKAKAMWRLSIVAITSTSLIACGASVDEYKKFASAGKVYSNAVDSLLASSSRIFINANSEVLLRSDSQVPAVDAKRLSDISKIDDNWLVLIARMRKHNELLKRYFASLESLADSNAPEEARKATEGIFASLESVSTAIQGSPLITKSIGKALSVIPEIIISQQIKGALRGELQQRKESIYRELILQGFVLKLLTSQLQGDLGVIRNNRDERLIYKPYVSAVPIGNKDAWLDQRRDIRDLTLSVEAINTANQASEDFKQAFQLLLEDKFTVSRANAFLAEVDSLLKVAEGLKKSNQPKSGDY